MSFQSWMLDQLEAPSRGTNAALIAAGHSPECVEYACPSHPRGCSRLGTPHAVHACYWCADEADDLAPEPEGGWPWI
jgi:hypothetical protein